MKGYWPYPDASVFGELRSLTKLTLEFTNPRPYTLTDVVGPLVPLTGLSELSIGFGCEPAVVPAALGQLKGLRALDLMCLNLVPMRPVVSICQTC